MARTLPSFLLFAVFAAVCSLCHEQALAQAQGQQSAVVKKAIEKATKQVRENLEEFEEQNKAPFAAAKQELTDEITKLNKAGKNDEATQVQNALNKLEETVLEKAKAPQKAQQPVVGNGVPLKETLVGKWDRGNSNLYWVILPNRVAGARKIADGAVPHPDSRFDIVAADLAEIVWPGNLRWRIRAAGDNHLAVEEIAADGKVIGDGLVLTRRT